jgi:hypothetical protein
MGDPCVCVVQRQWTAASGRQDGLIGLVKLAKIVKLSGKTHRTP